MDQDEEGGGAQPRFATYRYSRMTRERGISSRKRRRRSCRTAYRQGRAAMARFPANARQIMYAARDHIQKVTGQVLKSNYFTQTLLPDYLMETGVAWDVVYDARGNFNEPHGGHGFGVGTLGGSRIISSRSTTLLTDAGIQSGEGRRSAARAATSARCCSSRRRVSRRC